MDFDMRPTPIVIDTYSDMWDCFSWVIRALLIAALGIGIIAGVVLTFNCNNRTQHSNEIVGHLADGSPRHSIPTGTQIVAACSDDCRVFAYIVRDTKGNHYYVDLLSREVHKIEEVNLIREQLKKESNDDNESN